MATGIVGTIGPSSTLTYTPTVSTKVLIHGCCTSSSTGYTLTVNGQTYYYSMIGSYFGFLGSADSPLYLGAGQTLTVTTSSYMSATISVLEGN